MIPNVRHYVIRQELWLIGKTKKIRAPMLFDTGATISLVRMDVARQVARLDECGEPFRCISADGNFTVRHFIHARIGIARHRIHVTLAVAKELTEQVILGDDFMGTWGIMVDPKHNRIMVDPAALRIRA